MKELIDKLIRERTLTQEEFAALIDARERVRAYAIEQGRQTALRSFGNKIYIRGLIEMTNYCKNDCYYCGIRRSNRNCTRYRLTKEDILICAAEGYDLGFRTFVLQGGDPKGNGTGGSAETVAGEFSENGFDNPLTHTRGAISMARSQDYDSASSQFFIVLQDSTFLDGQYACFGYVTEGMELVDEICVKTPVADMQTGYVEPENQPVITAVTVID